MLVPHAQDHGLTHLISEKDVCFPIIILKIILVVGTTIVLYVLAAESKYFFKAYDFCSKTNVFSETVEKLWSQDGRKYKVALSNRPVLTLVAIQDGFQFNRSFVSNEYRALW